MPGSAFLCGVPFEYCEGGMKACSGGIRDSRHYGTNAVKAHGSRSSARLCYVHYITRALGYIRVGGREFRPPDGGPILVLTKAIRFGGRLRKGKQDRVMPDDPHTGGLIFGV